MQYLIKLTTIGPTRKALYKYIQRTAADAEMADFRAVSPRTLPCPVVKLADHHAKLHVHLLSRDDLAPEDLIEGLAREHPELRFTLYYEGPAGYGTIEAKNAAVQTHRKKQRE